MKTASILILLLAVTLLLSGCGHYGMGMGRHYYSANQTQQYGYSGNCIQGNGLAYSGAHLR